MILGTMATGAAAAVDTARSAGTPFRLPGPTLLVADPDPILLQALSAALLDRGVGRVLQVGVVDGVDKVLLGGIVGDLALIGLGFGSPAIRLIAGLRMAGWPRVITLAPTIDAGPLLDAFQAGATGGLRCPPGTPVRHAGKGPLPVLSAREIEILRMIADGRSNGWIARQLSLSPLTVKNHVARMTRKFGSGPRERMVAAALRGGIID